MPDTIKPRRRQGGSTEDKNQRHLTIIDVCADLQISRSTFYDWRQKNAAPPCFKLPNGALRVRREDYEEWLQLHYEGA